MPPEPTARATSPPTRPWQIPARASRGALPDWQPLTKDALHSRTGQDAAQIGRRDEIRSAVFFLEGKTTLALQDWMCRKLEGIKAGSAACVRSRAHKAASSSCTMDFFFMIMQETTTNEKTNTDSNTCKLAVIFSSDSLFSDSYDVNHSTLYPYHVIF